MFSWSTMYVLNRFSLRSYCALLKRNPIDHRWKMATRRIRYTPKTKIISFILFSGMLFVFIDISYEIKFCRFSHVWQLAKQKVLCNQWSRPSMHGTRGSLVFVRNRIFFFFFSNGCQGEIECFRLHNFAGRIFCNLILKQFTGIPSNCCDDDGFVPRAACQVLDGIKGTTNRVNNHSFHWHHRRSIDILLTPNVQTTKRNHHVQVHFLCGRHSCHRTR